jgi:ubiquinone/menaquinone biosynthesis C-methylase UbiE
MTQPEESALVSAGMWDRLAAAWDARGDWHGRVTAELTQQMVDQLEPAPGERVVELACGPTADGALEVARRCPECQVVATDLSPAMLTAAKRRGGDAVEYAILDVTEPDLPDHDVDGLLARWVYMLLPDPLAALGQARRVLKSDGRLVMAVFDRPSVNQFFMLPAEVMIERGHLQPPGPDEPSMFALADAARTTAILQRAGFSRISHRAVELRYTFADRDDLWSCVAEFTGPVSLVLARLDATEAEEIRTEIETRASTFSIGEGYALPGRALVFTAH